MSQLCLGSIFCLLFFVSLRLALAGGVLKKMLPCSSPPACSDGALGQLFLSQPAL